MQGNEQSIESLTRQLKTQSPRPHVVDLKFEACDLRVRTNSAILAERLRNYYGAYVETLDTPRVLIDVIEGGKLTTALPFQPYPRRDPGKRLKEEYADLVDGRVVRKVRTGMVFLFNHQVNVALGDCITNDNQVINFINSRYVEWLLSSHGVLLHAAGVSRDYQGIAIAGTSGTGKSTLALHLMRRGFSFVSNDRIIANCQLPGVRMYGVPKQPRVNPGTVLGDTMLQRLLRPERCQELRRLQPDELWNLEEKYDVDIEGIYGPDRMTLLARLSVLVLLNWSRSKSKPCIRRVELSERPDLLPLFMKSRGVFRAVDGPGNKQDASPTEYLETLGDCPVYEVSGGLSFQDAAEFFARLLSRSVHRMVCS